MHDALQRPEHMSQVEGGGVWACGVRPIGLEPCSSDTEVHNNLLELARTMNAEQVGHVALQPIAMMRMRRMGPHHGGQSGSLSLPRC